MLIWFGQLISLIGSGLTSFSLSFWVYGRSGSTAQFALVILAYSLPGIAIAPFAGAWVDRWDRRNVMLLSSLSAGMFTLTMAGLLWLGQVHAWQIAIAISGISISEAFQDPAYIASNTLLLSKEKLARGSGLIQLAQAIGLIASPLLAILLLGVVHIQTIMAVDFLTYVFLFVVLLRVDVPSPQPGIGGRALKGSLFFEALSGLRYVRSRKGMLSLLGLISVVVFAARMVQVLIVPMVLGIASNNALAMVCTVASSGMVLGSIAMAVWGGFHRRIYNVLGSGFVGGLALMVAGLSPSPAIIACALFVLGIVMPFGSASDQIIWQLKTPPDLQGRVLSFRRMMVAICLPLACILAGVFVDRFFKPLLVPNGALAETVGRFTGVGPARGVGLFLAVIGFLTVAFTMVSSLLPSLRKIELRLANAVGPDTPIAAFPAMGLEAVQATSIH